LEDWVRRRSRSSRDQPPRSTTGSTPGLRHQQAPAADARRAAVTTASGGPRAAEFAKTWTTRGLPPPGQQVNASISQGHAVTEIARGGHFDNEPIARLLRLPGSAENPRQHRQAPSPPWPGPMKQHRLGTGRSYAGRRTVAGGEHDPWPPRARKQAMPPTTGRSGTIGPCARSDRCSSSQPSRKTKTGTRGRGCGGLVGLRDHRRVGNRNAVPPCGPNTTCRAGTAPAATPPTQSRRAPAAG